LLFPTHGENYGHVIREALAAGCPVIISDQTPWRGLEALGVGWDLALSDPQAFTGVLQRCIDMDTAAFSQWVARAKEYGTNLSRDPDIVGQNRRLFARAMGQEISEAGGT